MQHRIEVDRVVHASGLLDEELVGVSRLRLGGLDGLVEIIMLFRYSNTLWHRA